MAWFDDVGTWGKIPMYTLSLYIIHGLWTIFVIFHLDTTCHAGRRTGFVFRFLTFIAGRIR